MPRASYQLQIWKLPVEELFLYGSNSYYMLFRDLVALILLFLDFWHRVQVSGRTIKGLTESHKLFDEALNLMTTDLWLKTEKKWSQVQMPAKETELYFPSSQEEGTTLW